MIIFGTRAKLRTLDEGEFFCPKCNMRRRYARKEARPYLALYFIPVFPVGKGVEFIECQTCGGAFEPAVLTMKPPTPRPDAVTLLNEARDRLKAGTPIDFVLRDLTATGLDYDVARATLDAQVGAERVYCPACGLSYVPEVRQCHECGGTLEPAGR
ncbi:MAG: hypothetical protein Kow0077_02130 [Anaerolineae bacterium]